MLTTFVFTEPNLEISNKLDIYDFFYNNLHVSTREQSRVTGKSALQILNDYLDTTLPNNTIPVSELYFALSNKIEPEINKCIKELYKVKDKDLETQYYSIANLVNKWLYGDNIFFYFYFRNYAFGDSVYNITITLPKLVAETTKLELVGVVYSKEV